MSNYIYDLLKKKTTVLSMFLLILSCMMSSLVPVMMMNVVKSIFDKEVKCGLVAFGLMATGMSLYILLQSLMLLLSNYLISKNASCVAQGMRDDIFANLISGAISYTQDKETGEYANAIVSDVNVLRDYMASEIPAFLNGALMIVFSTCIVVTISPIYSLLVYLVSVLLLVVMRCIGNLYERVYQERQEMQGGLNATAVNLLSIVDTVKQNGVQRIVKKKFGVDSMALLYGELNVNRVSARIGVVQNSFELVVLVVTAAMSVYVSCGNYVTAATLFLYAIQLLSPVNALSRVYSSSKSAKGVYDNVIRLLKSREDRFEYGCNPRNGIGGLEMRSVSYSYDNKCVISKISLELQVGEQIGIVGESGAGKSTLVRLMSGLCRPDSGSIDCGLFSKEIPIDEWRSIFTVVSQNPSVISGSLRENLQLAGDEEYTDRQMQHALTCASLEYLRYSLDMKINRQGLNLSGGERQRLQLARVFLRSSPFLILDEATANLDVETERRIISSIRKSMRYKTMVIISHRLTLMQDCDCVYLIKKGRLAAVGSHDELLASSSEYRNLLSN